MFLDDTQRRQVGEMLAPMRRPVRLAFGTRTFGCETCDDTKRLLRELADVDPRITVEEVNLVIDSDRANALGLLVAPSVAPLAVNDDGTEWDPGIRFLGIPAGYEFSSLLEAVVLVSTGEAALADSSRERLARVEEPTAIQVFVTPT
jgi:alkyl hydroperoxide reductase subunit AhpF